jgi:hypothetical protein
MTCSLRRSRSLRGASISVHRAQVFRVRLNVKLTLGKRTQLIDGAMFGFASIAAVIVQSC